MSSTREVIALVLLHINAHITTGQELRDDRPALQALLDTGLDKDRQEAIAEAMIQTLPLSLRGEGEPEV